MSNESQIIFDRLGEIREDIRDLKAETKTDIKELHIKINGNHKELTDKIHGADKQSYGTTIKLGLVLSGVSVVSVFSLLLV